MPPRPRYRRWIHPLRDHPTHARHFDRVLTSVGQQITAQQAARHYTQDQLVERAQPHMSARGLRSLVKCQSDPKVSTLVRLAGALDSDLLVIFRPRTGSALP